MVLLVVLLLLILCLLALLVVLLENFGLVVADTLLLLFVEGSVLAAVFVLALLGAALL